MVAYGRFGDKMTNLDSAPLAPLLVVVTGAPGSGKTTVAHGLAAKLRLPLLAKDDVKEALFDTLGSGDRAWSQRLGRATYEVMFAVVRRLLESGASCILESNFSDAEPLRSLPRARVVQIFCSAPDALVIERYTSRARHPGHLDAEIVEELRTRLARHEWKPLKLDGTLFALDTSDLVDVELLAERISRGA
jgi:predicted kinase